MLLVELLIAAAPLLGLGGLGAAAASAKRSRHPLMLQWGRFTNRRPGIKNDHARIAHEKQMGHLAAEANFGGWEDEPDTVEFEDFRYWLRFKPNFGINLPLIGYWSQARGRKRPPRPWERR